MSDNDKKVDPTADDAKPDVDADNATDTEVTSDDASAATTTTPTNNERPDAVSVDVTHARASAWPAILASFAMLLSLVAAAAVFWSYQRGPDALTIANEAAVGDVAQAQSDLERTLRQNEQALDDLQRNNNDVNDIVDSLQRDFERRLRPLEAMPGRLSGLEDSLAALQGISGGLRDSWLLAETEYYLQIANAQLQLASNPKLARIALDLADERLATLGNPALTNVRQVIANEMRSLDALVDTDIEGAALTLASLAGTIRSLQLKTDMLVPDFSDPSVNPELSGLDRAWASLKSSMSEVISVRRSDQPIKPLLPPDAAYFLRSNLTLQLQSARLALLRGEQTLFEQSLDDAASWIAEYYEADSTPVRSALATINELRQTEFRQAPPDISGSLALLRQYMSRRPRDRQPAADTRSGNPQ